MQKWEPNVRIEPRMRGAAQLLGPIVTADNLQPPISAYIRTLNEERMIGAVIVAACKVAREVIVVDSGSTDRTKEIAAAAGARIIEQPWLGNGGQKRAGEAACEHHWLLDLDADEILSDPLIESITKLFVHGEPPLSVYRLTLVTVPPIGEPWMNFALDPRAKLYDRRHWRMPDHKAWDQLILPKDTEVGSVSGALMHHSFRDFEHYVAKWNRVSSIRAKETTLRALPRLKLRMLFGPFVYFAKHYFFRGLWRAGWYGFAIARAVSFGRFMRDVKQYERRRRGQ
jgi:glycosyltransferase involved in cell wall biosynthesis